MGRRCCIEGCSSRSSAPEHHGVTYHSFPLDAAIRSVWLKNTRIQPHRNITKNVLVCSRHFRRADFQPMKSGKYLLKQRVFPTVFPWGKLDVNKVAEGLAKTGEATKPIPSVLTTPTAEAATKASVEATIAQIMAETAELNAAAGIKATSERKSSSSGQKGKQSASMQSVGDEQSMKATSSSGDTSSGAGGGNNSPSIKFEPVVHFNPGARLEAQDFDGIWHGARILEVDNDDREVLIKFEKSTKHKSTSLGSEEWIPMNSPRLRQKVLARPAAAFELDEKVMARWSGPRRFPGTVKKILGNDIYEILFDDGFVKNVRANHMNKVESPSSKSLSDGSVKALSPLDSNRLQKVALGSGSGPSSLSLKQKRGSTGSRKDWPLLSMDKLDLDSLNLPEIPKDGEWTCHWVNDQPIGKEGYLIVGEHKKPTVIVQDWRLPPGWVKHMYQRSNVLGKWDVILVTPNGKRFRSKSDLKAYLEDLGQFYNPDIYDFSIHRRRAKDINAYVFTSDYTPQHYKARSLDSSVASNKSGPVEKRPDMTAESTPTSTMTALSSSLVKSSSQFIETPVATPLPPMELMTPQDGTTERSGGTPSRDGYAIIGGLKVQIVDNLFRCPQEGCAKNFRKENHLQIHVKHYHRNLMKLMGFCPKMQELAEKRSLGTPDSSDTQPKNQIPNQEFFAKLHKQDLEQSRSHRKNVSVGTGTTTAVGTPEREDSAMLVSNEGSSPDRTVCDEDGEKADETVTTPSVVKQSNTPQSAATADSSTLDWSVGPSVGDEQISDVSFSAGGLPIKRPRFSPNKRAPGSRRSNRQRTTRRYLTAAQATSRLLLPPVVTADSMSLYTGDMEETRHSFNRTPDEKSLHVGVKKRKLLNTSAASRTPLSSMGSPVTADSGSSSFLPMQEDGGSSAVAHTMASDAPQYIKENGELIKIVSMRQEEIINCLCAYGEEDGLMIQCELCLCWQHGICNGIDKESDVPDKYICYICRNPQRGRTKMRYRHDQDWLFEGKLPVGSYHTSNPEHTQRFQLLKNTHALTANLVELKRFMHALRVKMNIANNRCHPKMYLWAKKWDDEDSKSDIPKEEVTEVKTEGEEAAVADNAAESPTVKVESEARDAVDEKATGTASNSATPAKKMKMEADAQTPMVPQPETPIDPVECQHRLLEHIKVQQLRVMERLSKIEVEIDELEKQDALPDLKNADIGTTKDVLSSFIKELEIVQQIAKLNSFENHKQSLQDSPEVK